MSEEMAKQAVKVLTDNLKGDFPPKGMRDIWRELCQSPDKAINSAVDYLILNSNGFLPSPAKLIDRVRLDAKLVAAKEAKDREDEWNRQKGGATRKDLEKRETIFSREQSDAHGRHAVQAIRLMMSNASRADKLECFRVMESNYPGAGWGLSGAKKQKEWEKRCESCVIGTDITISGRDMSQSHKWYGCFGSTDCKHGGSVNTSTPQNEKLAV